MADAPQRGKSLTVRDLKSGYGAVMVLHGISLRVEAGRALGLKGANGSGKTTLLKTIAGALPTSDGLIEIGGDRIESMAAHRRVAGGLALVPEGRQIIGSLSVQGNLDITLLSRGKSRRDAEHRRRIDEVFDLFPILSERREQQGSSLSGGQQQMLAIARALMTRPDVLLLDEPTQGLASIVVDEVISTLLRLKQTCTIVVVEHHEALLDAVADDLLEIHVGRIRTSDRVSAQPPSRGGHEW